MNGLLFTVPFYRDMVIDLQGQLLKKKIEMHAVKKVSGAELLAKYTNAPPTL